MNPSPNQQMNEVSAQRGVLVNSNQPRSYDEVMGFISTGLWLLPAILLIVLIVQFITENPGNPNWYGIISLCVYFVVSFMTPERFSSLSPSIGMIIILLRKVLFCKSY